MALTACGTPRVRDTVREVLRLKLNWRWSTSTFYRQNLALRVQYQVSLQKDMTPLVEELKRKPASAIIYCVTITRVANIVEHLQKRLEGYLVLPYTSDETTDHRDKVLADFMGNEAVVVVATICFGMGINKANVRWIIQCAAVRVERWCL
jgi:ATP-dependent DNA helicase RecQ